MRGPSFFVACSLTIVALVAFGGHTRAEEGAGRMEIADPLSYVRIYSDAMGESHFVDEEFPFALVDFAPPTPPVSVTEAMAAASVAVISSPAGWHGDWHPAPRRQLMFVLAGELEVRVSDGEFRRFGPGAVLLVEDTVGKGHVSTVVSNERLFMANVPLSD
jgi:quercetin dioxygenase-like cupin family protein